MSLTSRRMLKEITELTQKAETTLKEKTGLDISLTTDESSFPEDELVLKDFYVHQIYGVDSVINALTAITADDLGKEAVKESIKSIVLINTATSWKDKGTRDVTLADGVLRVSCAFSEGSDNLYKPEVLEKAIINLL